MDRRDTGLDFSRDKAYDAEALAQSAEKNKSRKAQDAAASPASEGEAKDKRREKKPTGSRVTISPPSAFHETTTEVLETLPPEQRAEVETAKDTLIKKRKAAMKGLRRSYSSVVSGLRISSTDEDDGEDVAPDVEHRTMLPAAWYIVSHYASARVWVISLIAILALIVASLALFLVPKEVASIINVRFSAAVLPPVSAVSTFRCMHLSALIIFSTCTCRPTRATSTCASPWRRWASLCSSRRSFIGAARC